MEIVRAYKTELDPNNKQRTFFGRCCGASRYIYNWGLAEWKRQYDADEKPSRFKLCKQFNGIKDELCPWVREVPYAVTESAFVNLGNAFKHFFRRVKSGEKKKGYPKFKKRSHAGSFQVRNTRVQEAQVRITGVGWVKLKEKQYIPSDARKYGTYATVSEKAGRWYISVQVYEEIPDPVNDNTLVLGVDFGIKSLAVCSDGNVYENPHSLRQALRKLAKLNRELARRKKGSRNWYKTKRNLQRCHAKVANIRKHVLHHISHDLVVNKRPGTVVIENLNVSGMASNHRLAQAVLDAGFYELRRQVEYKAQWHGVEVIVADRWYASSKTCSNCSNIKEDLTLADRELICNNCGLTIDRDLNAAMNLSALGEGRNTPGLPVELECSEALL